MKTAFKIIIAVTLFLAIFSYKEAFSFSASSLDSTNSGVFININERIESMGERFSVFFNKIAPLSNIKAYKRWNEEDISWRIWFRRGYVPVIAFISSAIGIILLLSFDIMRINRIVNKNFKELWEAEENYYRLLEIVSDAVIIMTPDGEKILQVNQKAEELTGHLRADLLQMSFFSLTLRSEDKINRQLLMNIKDEDFIRKAELNILTKDKEIIKSIANGRFVKGYNKTITLLTLSELK